jgi:hypothetical protein
MVPLGMLEGFGMVVALVIAAIPGVLAAALLLRSPRQWGLGLFLALVCAAAIGFFIHNQSESSSIHHKFASQAAAGELGAKLEKRLGAEEEQLSKATMKAKVAGEDSAAKRLEARSSVLEKQSECVSAHAFGEDAEAVSACVERKG